MRNRWRKLPRVPIKPRFEHSAIWTGTEMIVFGGAWDFGHIALGDGVTYDPESNLARGGKPCYELLHLRHARAT